MTQELFLTAVKRAISQDLSVADLFGVTEMTARRWRKGLFSPPINPDAWLKVTEKEWRLPVSALDARAMSRIPADDPAAVLGAIRRRRAVLGLGNRRKKTAVLSTRVA